MSDSTQHLNKSLQVFRKALQDLAFHSDEANALCQKLWATFLLSPQLRGRDEKKKKGLARLKCEPASQPLFIREPANCGHYLRRVRDGLGENETAPFSLLPTLPSACLSHLDLCLEMFIKFSLQFALRFKS